MELAKNSKKKRVNSVPNFGILLGGMTLSKIGNIIFDYVNSIWIVGLASNSSMVMAIYQSSQIIVNIFLNIFGGVFADRYDRKKILVLTDSLFALTAFICALYIESKLAVYIIVIANIILAAVNSFNSPCYRAIVKEAIIEKNIGKFNSLFNGLSESVRLVGPLVGLMLINVVSTKGALIIISLIFLTSAILEANLSIERADRKSKTNNNKVRVKTIAINFINDITDGVKYLAINKKLLFIITVVAFVNFFLSGYNLLIPYTNKIYSSIVSDMYSKCILAEAVGGILASIVNSKFELVKRDEFAVTSLLITGLSIFMLSLLSNYEVSWIVLIIPIFIMGASLTIFNINFITYIQVNTDENYLGRIFSILFTIAGLFMPVGTIMFQRFLDFESMNGFMIVGIGIIAIGIIASLMSRHVIKSNV